LGECGVEVGDGLGKISVLFEEESLVSGAEGAEVFVREATSLQSDLVDPPDRGGVPIDNGERRDVLDDLGDSSGDGVSPDPAELVDSGEARDDGVVVDPDMSGEGAIVGKNDMVSHLTVVGDVGVGEKKIVGTHAGRGIGVGPAVDGGVFPEDIAITHDEGGRFAGIFQVLGLDANGGEGKELVVIADLGLSVNDNMGVKLAAVAETDPVFDHAVRADFRFGAQGGPGGNDGGRMNHADVQEGVS
jgi:hypothetical protein